MRNRDQILHELLLRGKLHGIHHHQSAAMHLTEVNEQAPSKTSQSIFVGNEQQRDFPGNDRIDESEKLLALEIESPANFCNPFIDDISIGGAPLGEHPALVLQLRFLRHKERKFGRGCIDVWRAHQKELLVQLAERLVPFEEMLLYRPFLLDNWPRFLDFDLYGMLANFLYSGHYRLPTAHTAIKDWYRRMTHLQIKSIK